MIHARTITEDTLTCNFSEKQIRNKFIFLKQAYQWSIFMLLYIVLLSRIIVSALNPRSEISFRVPLDVKQSNHPNGEIAKLESMNSMN